ncbi:dihydroorotate dehydrogenase [Patescibacteria group bacterium]|nr:dihydroorotate dehydrogenase [Patescibacteria group bacterium]
MDTVPKWFPDRKPIYDIHKTYDENFAEGPFFDAEIPKREMPPKEDWIDFLGINVASPLGVPAGPLLNSKWTTLASKLGFDIVTYKTIRTGEHPSQPAPNMVYVDTIGPIEERQINEEIPQKMNQPENMAMLAVTNSFGMPSQSEQYVLEDLSRAIGEIQEGQLLVASVVGTPRDGEDFVADFARAAALAKESGAKAIEANFSCPNVATGEGSIYTNPKTVHELCSRIVREIGDIPLLIKVGYFKDQEEMRETFVEAAKAGARGVSGINTIGMKVMDGDKPALGEGRETSGVCGEPIQKLALAYVHAAREINDTQKLGLELVGVGGITLPEHFDLFLESGADVAMSATGMMWDPFLALRWHELHQK